MRSTDVSLSRIVATRSEFHHHFVNSVTKRDLQYEDGQNLPLQKNFFPHGHVRIRHAFANYGQQQEREHEPCEPCSLRKPKGEGVLGGILYAQKLCRFFYEKSEILFAWRGEPFFTEAHKLTAGVNHVLFHESQ